MGSEEDLKKSKRVTDIHYPVVPHFQKLTGLKAQNIDDVEGNASRCLNFMKQKDPVKAEEFDKARVPWPREKKKMCSQTKALMEGIVAEYGTEMISPMILNMKKWEKEKEEYIGLSFVEWGWHTNEEHDAYMASLEEQIKSEATPPEEKESLRAYAQALRLERAKFRQYFSNEFKFTQKTLVHSVRYKRNINEFRALLVWQDDKSKEPKDEIITVPESWVKEEFGELMLQQIIYMRQEDLGWTQTPRNVAVFIGKWKIARVK